MLSTVSSITTLTAGLAIADPVVVAWQIDDLRLFPGEYATSLARRINVTLPASTSTLNFLQPTSQTPPSGLSTGAKAGISVGSVVAAAIVGMALTTMYLRHRRKAAVLSVSHGNALPEMEDQDRNFKEHRWFFGGRWRSEVEAIATQNELDSKPVHVVPGPPAELEAFEPQVPAEILQVEGGQTETSRQHL